MANQTDEQNVPRVEKQGDEWIVTSPRAASIRTKDRALAHRIWDIATWSYRNGLDDARDMMRTALGLQP